MEDNPFSHLFSTNEDLLEAAETAQRQKWRISDLLTRIFLFTNANGNSFKILAETHYECVSVVSFKMV